MARTTSGDMHRPYGGDFDPDVATLLIARAWAEAYRAAIGEPVPEPLAAILRQIQATEVGHDRHAA